MDNKVKLLAVIVSLFFSLGFTILAIKGLEYSQELWRSVAYVVGLLTFGSFVCANLTLLYKLKKSH